MICWPRRFNVRPAPRSGDATAAASCPTCCAPGAASRSVGRLGALLVVLAMVACVRSINVGPLPGTPTTRPLPSTALPAGHHSLIFRWHYRERVFSARGDGIARVAPPDSARIDLFLDNGTSAGFVILIADSLSVIAQENVHRFVPPVPMLWAALGRVTMTGSDTVVHVDGDTLRAEIGPSPAWRLAFLDGAVRQVQRLDGRRVEDALERTDTAVVVYRQPGAARTLTLNIVRRTEESAFDASIWRP